MIQINIPENYHMISVNDNKAYTRNQESKEEKQICEILIEKSQNGRFLRQIVTMDENGFILGILVNLVSRLP